MTDPDSYIAIDNQRSAQLSDVGAPGYALAVGVAPDGNERLFIAELAAIGTARFDPTCSDVAHEQLGSLPLGVVRRITVAQRTHRCGRPTGSGDACRITVSRSGDACRWHRDTNGRRDSA
jgi:hypothetical protein